MNEQHRWNGSSTKRLQKITICLYFLLTCNGSLLRFIKTATRRSSRYAKESI